MPRDKEASHADGRTLEERALLVLRAKDGTLTAIRDAYRQAAKRYHPDTPHGNKAKFQVVNEAYAFLMRGILPRQPLLANDALVAGMIGQSLAPLSARPSGEGYETWHWDHFYWDW